MCGGMSGGAPTMSRSRSRDSRNSALFSASMKTAPNGGITAPRAAVFAALSGSRPPSLPEAPAASSPATSPGTPPPGSSGGRTSVRGTEARPPWDIGRIGAGKGQMPGGEQQTDAAAGRRHQTVDLGRGLNNRPHVVVIGEAEAPFNQAVGQLGEAEAE